MKRRRQTRRYLVQREQVVTISFYVDATSAEFARIAPTPANAQRHEGMPSKGYASIVDGPLGWALPGYYPVPGNE